MSQKAPPSHTPSFPSKLVERHLHEMISDTRCDSLLVSRFSFSKLTEFALKFLTFHEKDGFLKRLWEEQGAKFSCWYFRLVWASDFQFCLVCRLLSLENTSSTNWDHKLSMNVLVVLQVKKKKKGSKKQSDANEEPVLPNILRRYCSEVILAGTNMQQGWL